MQIKSFMITNTISLFIIISSAITKIILHYDFNAVI